jgi:hypothetical protein
MKKYQIGDRIKLNNGYEAEVICDLTTSFRVRVEFPHTLELPAPLKTGRYSSGSNNYAIV